MATLEICVDTPAGLAAAIEGGADRIELCSALALGGLTPTPGLMHLAARAPVPVYAMIRPRAGSFRWSADEVEAMRAEIRAVRAAGLAGVVLGASREDFTLDAPMLDLLLGEARGLGATLHRAFDLVPDRAAALETAVALGFERILTSGGATTAPEGAAALGELMNRAGGRIAIMAGSGVRAETVAGLLDAGLREIHASCARPPPVQPDSALLRFGFASAGQTETGMEAVRALRRALAEGLRT
jgi:copper homeostasis protein